MRRIRRKYNTPSRKYAPRRKSYARGGRGVTSQYDRAQIYRKTYMPRRKKVRWRRFVKKVQAVTSKERCGRSVVFNKGSTIQSLSAGDNGYGSFGLLNVKGANGANELGMGDLFDLLNSETELNASNSKMLLKSAVLDITFSAPYTYTTTAGSDTLNWNPVPVEMDVYEIVPKKRPAFTGFGAAISDAQGDTPTIGTTYTPVSMDSRGCTLFQLPQLLMNYTIVKKTKYTLNPGQNCTYQVRDPTNRTIEYKEVIDDSGSHAFSKYGSKIVFAVVKLVAGNAGVFDFATIDVGCTRTYYYTYEGCNTYKDGYKNI